MSIFISFGPVRVLFPELDILVTHSTPVHLLWVIKNMPYKLLLKAMTYKLNL